MNDREVFKKGNNMGKKSYNHLFEQLIDRENIRKAIHNAFKKKKKLNLVKEILDNIDFHIENIRNMLLRGEFTPQWHEIVEIPDYANNKIRLAMMPFYKNNSKGKLCYEHIIHHLLMLVLIPIFMKGMYYWSCGSVPKRGSHHGKKYIERFIREHKKDCRYCYKSDVYHFYREIDTNILKNKLRKKIHDEKFLKVLFAVIDSNKGKYKGRLISLGLPIGFYTSQWLANFYLQDFDHFVKEKLKIKCYTRYVDDKAIFGSNKRKLRKTLLEIKEFLKNEHLSLKPNYQIFKFSYIDKGGTDKGRPLDMLGYKFYENRTTLRKRILHNILQKACKLYKKIINGIDISWYEATQMMSYIGYLNVTDTHRWYEKYIRQKVNFGGLKGIISHHANKKERKINNGICKIRKHSKTCSNR